MAQFTRLILLLAVVFAGSWAALKWMRVGIRTAIWRLRNRLVVAYLFIALVPVVLVGIMAYMAGVSLAAQVAVYLVSSEFDRRIASLRNAAGALLQCSGATAGTGMAGYQRGDERQLSGMEVLIRDRGKAVFPHRADDGSPPRRL